MDVDVVPQPDLSGQTGEDLIDYDEDEMQLHQSNVAVSALDEMTTADYQEPRVETKLAMNSTELESPKQTILAGSLEVDKQTQSDLGNDLSSGAEPANAIASTAGDSGHQSPILLDAADEVDVDIGNGEEDEAANGTSENDDAVNSIHEIDYEYQENGPSPQEHHVSASGSQGEGSDERPEEDNINPTQATEAIATDEDVEITWDNSHADNTQAHSHGHEPFEDADTAKSHVYVGEASAEGDGDSSWHEEATSHGPQHEHSHEEQGDGEAEVNLMIASHIEGESVEEYASDKGDHTDFPNITVQYRGEEYPMFSSTSEGFFSELSALDDNLEALLAGFRAELADEIPSGDELVFQIDELGLEIAESREHGSLSSTSLRQVLEIFDLLVKNQDPDGSRVLYTYLFTKPSPNKRFEFLAESAAAGKGLDEVTDLFESPFARSHQVGGAVEAGEGEDGQSTGLQTSMDDPEMNEEQSSTSSKEDSILDDVHVGAVTRDDDITNANIGPTGGLAIAEEVEDSMTKDAPRGNDEMVIGETDLEESFLDKLPTESTEVDSSSFLDLQEPGEGDEEAGQENFDLTGDGVAESGITITSTTDTLQDEEDTVSALLDEAVGASTALESAEASLVGEEELNEIDWRDNSDADDNGEEVASATAKRGQTDAELDTEDENDAKRRRP